MNSAQIQNLANAIANLIAVSLQTAMTETAKTVAAPSAPAIAPKAQTAKAAPAKADKVVTGPKVQAAPAKLPVTASGLIDVSKLTGLVKARAVAANNRAIAAKLAA